MSALGQSKTDLSWPVIVCHGLHQRFPANALASITLHGRSVDRHPHHRKHREFPVLLQGVKLHFAGARGRGKLPMRYLALQDNFKNPGKLERAKGFEPSTPTLARLCSTPELRPLLS